MASLVILRRRTTLRSGLEGRNDLWCWLELVSTRNIETKLYLVGKSRSKNTELN